MIFDWDHANIEHLARHKITPQEAEYVLSNDPYEGEPQSVNGEDRFPYIGETPIGRILEIVITFRKDAVRVVTGWDVPAAAKREYLRRRTEIWQRR